MSSPLADTPEGARLALRVSPKAGQNALAGVREGRLLVKVTAPPEDGKANAAVIKLLAKLWRVSTSQFELLSGVTSRDKVLLIRGVTSADLPLPQ